MAYNRWAGRDAVAAAAELRLDVYMASEDIQKALDEANELLEAGKPAETLRRLDKIEEAIFESDLRIECGSLRGWALAELGKIEEALEALDLLIEEYPDSARLLSVLGVVLSQDGNLELACDALEEAVAIDDEDEVAVANLALVYERLRDYPRALELYDRAIELGVDIDWLLQRKAETLAEFGRFGEAKSCLRRYLSLAPEDAEQWISLAILHCDDEEYEQASACYQAACRVTPKATSLHLNWGVTAVRFGDLTEAEKRLAQLGRIEPGGSRYALLGAMIKQERGHRASKNAKQAEAADAFEQAERAYADALARVDRSDYGEHCYTLEMAMDFHARVQQHERCEALFEQAYAANACSVELCEAYREAAGTPAGKFTWYSMMIEADYRDGLHEVLDRAADPPTRRARFLRNVQVVARDRDDAVALALGLVERMGEKNAAIREFVSEEPISDTQTGLYEIERDSLVFGPESVS